MHRRAQKSQTARVPKLYAQYSNSSLYQVFWVPKIIWVIQAIRVSWYTGLTQVRSSVADSLLSFIYSEDNSSWGKTPGTLWGEFHALSDKECSSAVAPRFITRIWSSSIKQPYDAAQPYKAGTDHHKSKSGRRWSVTTECPSLPRCFTWSPWHSIIWLAGQESHSLTNTKTCNFAFDLEIYLPIMASILLRWATSEHHCCITQYSLASKLPNSAQGLPKDYIAHIALIFYERSKS